MTQRSITSLLLLSLSSWCHAAELRSASSRCLAIGQTTEITLQGSDLAIENNEDPQLWTSFPATMELVKPQKRDRNRVTFRITPGTDAKPGIAAIRAYNSQGVSHPLFVWLDRVPVTRGEERVELQSAQELKLPATVGGNTPDRRQLFFRFQAQAGQTLSAEVIAQRIGLDTDAVIALLDEKGRELISADDDPVLGADCRFSLRIPTTGTYFLMLHDLQYRGGRPYLLRVGDFSLVENVFPLGMTPGKMAELEAIEIGVSRSTKLSAILGDEAFAGVHEIEIDDHGPTARVFASSLDQHLEAEPNNDQQTANSITIPAAINGRFLARGDVDFYKFSAKQGQRLTISPKTRSVSSPSFVRIKLLDGEGNVLLDSRESGLNEAIQRVRIAKDDDYYLAITDILRGGGPSHGYHVLLELNRAPFTLTAPYDKKRPRHRPVAIPGGVLLVPLKIHRHGYNGPIRLTASTREGKLDVANEVIPEGKNDAGLRIRIPASLKTPALTAILVEG
ncbi:MAG: PPC domain-containing protein, partial [Planctomycetes bacterium]|nr:PPC domain-containing protein [Planctomycetota bacterium]